MNMHNTANSTFNNNNNFVEVSDDENRSEVHRPSLRRSSALALRRLSSQVEILFAQVLGLDSLADLSASSSIQTQDVTNGIEDSLNFVQCKKTTKETTTVDSNDPKEDSTCQGEGIAQESKPSSKKKQRLSNTKRSGSRRGNMDGGKGGGCGASESL